MDIILAAIFTSLFFNILKIYQHPSNKNQSVYFQENSLPRFGRHIEFSRLPIDHLKKYCYLEYYVMGIETTEYHNNNNMIKIGHSSDLVGQW